LPESGGFQAAGLRGECVPGARERRNGQPSSAHAWPRFVKWGFPNPCGKPTSADGMARLLDAAVGCANLRSGCSLAEDGKRTGRERAAAACPSKPMALVEDGPSTALCGVRSLSQSAGFAHPPAESTLQTDCRGSRQMPAGASPSLARAPSFLVRPSEAISLRRENPDREADRPRCHSDRQPDCPSQQLALLDDQAALGLALFNDQLSCVFHSSAFAVGPRIDMTAQIIDSLAETLAVRRHGCCLPFSMSRRCLRFVAVRNSRPGNAKRLACIRPAFLGHAVSCPRCQPPAPRRSLSASDPLGEEGIPAN